MPISREIKPGDTSDESSRKFSNVIKVLLDVSESAQEKSVKEIFDDIADDVIGKRKALITKNKNSS